MTDGLVDAVRRSRLAFPDANARQIFEALSQDAEWAQVSLSDVKRACSKATKMAAQCRNQDTENCTEQLAMTPRPSTAHTVVPTSKSIPTETKIDIKGMAISEVVDAVRDGDVGVCLALSGKELSSEFLRQLFDNGLVDACLAHCDSPTHPRHIAPVNLIFILSNVLIFAMLAGNATPTQLQPVRKRMLAHVKPLAKKLSTDEQQLFGSFDSWQMCVCAFAELLWNCSLDTPTLITTVANTPGAEVCIARAFVSEEANIRAAFSAAQDCDDGVARWHFSSTPALSSLLESDSSCARIALLVGPDALTSAVSDKLGHTDLNGLMVVYDRLHRAHICEPSFVDDPKRFGPSVVRLVEACLPLLALCRDRRAHQTIPHVVNILRVALRGAYDGEKDVMHDVDRATDWRAAVLVSTGALEAALTAAAAVAAAAAANVEGLVNDLLPVATLPSTKAALGASLSKLERLSVAESLPVKLRRRLSDLVSRVNGVDKSARDKAKENKACKSCHKPIEGPAKCCSTCGAFYCSKECQKYDWKKGGHKAICQMNASAGASIGGKATTDMRASLQTIFKERETHLVMQAHLKGFKTTGEFVVVLDQSTAVSLATVQAVDEMKKMLYEASRPGKSSDLDHIFGTVIPRNVRDGNLTIYYHTARRTEMWTTVLGGAFQEMLGSVYFMPMSAEEKKEFIAKLALGEAATTKTGNATKLQLD